MGVDEEGRALATPEYWNTRYTTSSGPEPTHEWFRSYAALEPFFARHLFPSYPPSSNPQILHLGSGDSTVPYDLAQKGYKNQTCLDFSQVVVDLMSQRHAEVEGITWRWADVRDTREQAHDGSVDVAFDKGTLDAMIHGSPWDPPEQVREDTARYMREVRNQCPAHRRDVVAENEGRSTAPSSPQASFFTSHSVNRISSNPYSTPTEDKVYGTWKWKRWAAEKAHSITSPSSSARRNHRQAHNATQTKIRAPQS